MTRPCTEVEAQGPLPGEPDRVQLLRLHHGRESVTVQCITVTGTVPRWGIGFMLA